MLSQLDRIPMVCEYDSVRSQAWPWTSATQSTPRIASFDLLQASLFHGDVLYHALELSELGAVIGELQLICASAQRTTRTTDPRSFGRSSILDTWVLTISSPSSCVVWMSGVDELVAFVAQPVFSCRSHESLVDADEHLQTMDIGNSLWAWKVVLLCIDAVDFHCYHLVLEVLVRLGVCFAGQRKCGSVGVQRKKFEDGMNHFNRQLGEKVIGLPVRLVEVDLQTRS